MVLALSIFFTVILVVGVKIATHEEMVLNHLKLKAENVNNKWMEPIILCSWCMPSIWSIAGYFFSFLYLCDSWNIDYKQLLFYPITVCASSILAGVIWTFILYVIELLDGAEMHNQIFKIQNYQSEEEKLSNLN